MMNKIQNKKIILTLSLLVILGTTVLIAPQKASALNASYNIETAGSSTQSNTNNNYNNNQNVTYYNDTTNYNTTPIIYSISPNSAVSGNNTVVATITGANFTPGSTARFNGADKETRYYDSRHLGMVLSPIDLDGKGTYFVTVYNPSNGSISNGVSFTLNKTVATSSGSVTKKVTKSTTSTVAKAKTSSTSTSNNSNALSANALSGSNGFFPSSLIEWLLLAILIFLVVILVRKTYMSHEEHAPLKHA
ncbi:MAG: IPT/TIG domain-containing protein [Patescibacteria group bacterium]